MVDPSFLFSEEGLTWLEEDGKARNGIVVPSSLIYALQPNEQTSDLLRFVAPEDREAFDERRARLGELLLGVTTFSSGLAALDPAADEVRVALLGVGGAAGEILAEEWAFLLSHSWALSRVRLPLDAFRDAGAAVIEYGRKLRDQMVAVVIPGEGGPPVLTPELLAKAAAKWVIVGGVGAGATTLGPAGGAIGLLAIPAVRAFDP